MATAVSSKKKQRRKTGTKSLVVTENYLPKLSFFSSISVRFATAPWFLKFVKNINVSFLVIFIARTIHWGKRLCVSKITIFVYF